MADGAVEGNAVDAASGNPERPLPDQHLTRENIEGHYVQFIFACNPFLIPTLDATDLRKGFTSIPRSDGKTYDIYNLFLLVVKLDRKEIDTWTNLVVELGVERPDPAKNQSTQKLQQYSVRLKRWLHAYHIDAFFQYSLGRPNTYYTEIPALGPDAGGPLTRDGVPWEDDLALRALSAQFRPKRYRRSNIANAADDTPPTKRARAASMAVDPAVQMQAAASSQPHSALPGDRAGQIDPWAAAQRAFLPLAYGSQANTAGPVTDDTKPGSGSALFRIDYSKQQSNLGTPQSAIEGSPRLFAGGTEMITEARSAHPASAGSERPRRRAGLSIAGAWPSSTSPGGKRGRPPGGARGTPNGTPGSDLNAGTPSSSQARGPSKLSLHVPPSSGSTPMLLHGLHDAAGTGLENGKVASALDSLTGPPLTWADVDADGISVDDEPDLGSADEVDAMTWKKRALAVQKKLAETQAELRAVRRRVMEAVM